MGTTVNSQCDTSIFSGSFRKEYHRQENNLSDRQPTFLARFPGWDGMRCSHARLTTKKCAMALSYSAFLLT